MVFSLLKSKARYQDPDLHPGSVPTVVPVAPEQTSETPLPTATDGLINVAPETIEPVQILQTSQAPITRTQLYGRLKKRRLIVASGAVLIVLVGAGAVYTQFFDKSGDVDQSSQVGESSDSSDPGTELSGQAPTENPDKPVSSTPKKQAPVSSSSSQTETEAPTSSGSSGSTSAGQAPAYVPKTYTVEFTRSGCYTPKSLTINKSDTIKFVNLDSPHKMQPVSNSTQFPNFGASQQYAYQESYYYTFTKAGSLTYYDKKWFGCTGAISIR